MLYASLRSVLFIISLSYTYTFIICLAPLGHHTVLNSPMSQMLFTSLLLVNIFYALLRSAKMLCTLYYASLRSAEIIIYLTYICGSK